MKSWMFVFVVRLDTIEDDGEESDPVISRFFLNVTVSKTESCGDAGSQFTLYCIQVSTLHVPSVR